MDKYEVNNTLSRMYHEVLFAIEHGYSIDACDFSNRILFEKPLDFVNLLRALAVEAIKNFETRFSRGNIDGELYTKNIITYKIIIGIIDAYPT